jgi:uncharacterized protein with PhoU and TrkA domain
MERAKRLELKAGKSESPEQIAVVNSGEASDTQLSPPAAELAEIVASWPGLNREIQAAVLTLVRVVVRARFSHFSEDTRPTLPNPTF